MNINPKSLCLLLLLYCTGCAYYLPTTQEERIAQYKNSCEAMGFKSQTIEQSNCVLELEKAYLSSRGYGARRSGTMNNNARTQQMIDNDRTGRQIMNHGAGGCTPNFSTGGCL